MGEIEESWLQPGGDEASGFQEKGALFTEETVSRDPFVPEPRLSTLNRVNSSADHILPALKARIHAACCLRKGGPHGGHVGLRLGSGSPRSSDPTGELMLEPWEEVCFTNEETEAQICELPEAAFLKTEGLLLPEHLIP